MAIASRERTAQKYGSENRSHGSASSLRQSGSVGVMAGKREEWGVMAFRAGACRRHKPKSVAVIPGTKLRSLKARPFGRDL